MSTTKIAKRGPKAVLSAQATGPAVDPTLCIAGIGASAGGFEAIRHFFKATPADSGVAFVVVQHLDPTHVSLAAELFAKMTAMPVREATDGLRVQANHVYTSPSDKDVAMQDGCLRLTERGSRVRLHLPIDHFFNSLGEDCGARAIGVVLSGMGTDGTLGLKSIASHGGVVLVQDPKTAQYDSMPRSAIDSGVANYVLPVGKMGSVISGYSRHPYAAGLEKTKTDAVNLRAIQSLLKIIHDQQGYDFSGYKRSTLLRRIERRMGLRGVATQSAYVVLLKKEPTEVNALLRDLLIGVTEFFRDQAAWRTLETEVIEPLVATKGPHDPIRIWVPGCSTGEEAYTLAILVLDRLRRTRKTCTLQIFATDTNGDALEVGRAGRYPVGIATRMSPTRLKRYFVKDPQSEYWTVSETLRSTVVFCVQNLFSDPPFGRMDLISCRNVMIYLESDLQKRLLNIFHFALNKDGYLMLGSAESNNTRDDLFAPISKKWRIFKRAGSVRSGALSLPPRGSNNLGGTQVAAVPSTPPLSRLASIAQKLILERFAPAAVLIDNRNQALYFFGPIDNFLGRPRGAPVQDLLLLVREGLRARLRAALAEAAASHLTTRVIGAHMKRRGGFAPVIMTIAPHAGNDSGPLYLVVFEFEQQPMLPNPTPGDALSQHLEGELHATREDLQASHERFELAANDLRVSNEEVVTSNEELRSLNEELESSKEELQSLNEELTTVNQQLESKMHELEEVNTDLNNLLNSSEIATICLDRALHIKWFTPAAHNLFKFLPADLGRPIGDFALAQGGTGVIEAAQAVMANKSVTLEEFESASGRCYMRRALPYHDEKNTICGIILTYTDITESRLATQAANLARKDLDESQNRTDKMRTLSAALAMAETRERRALAQDLHDDLGQMLAMIKLKIATMEKLEIPTHMRNAMNECSRAVDQANRKVRMMAFQLNPPMLDELGLAAAIEWMADEMHQMYKLDVHTHDDGKQKPMNPAVSATLFRGVRELLINIAKHAGVTQATVTTARDKSDKLVLTVSDAGKGFDPDVVSVNDGSGGFGLLSVRERINLLGGEVAIRSNPDNGTTVIIKVPLLGTVPDAKTIPRGQP